MGPERNRALLLLCQDERALRQLTANMLVYLGRGVGGQPYRWGRCKRAYPNNQFQHVLPAGHQYHG